MSSKNEMFCARLLWNKMKKFCHTYMSFDKIYCTSLDVNIKNT
jgi:hypothetical protein